MVRIFLSIALFILVSCSSGHEPDALSVAVAQEPPSADLMVGASVSGRNILAGNVYERLLAYSDGKIVPVLASSYTLSDDGRDLSISIREDVLFHDGSRFDVHDAVLSLNRWMDSYAAASRAAGGARFAEEDGRAVIHSDSSLALFPMMLSSSPQCAVMLPSECIEDLQPGEIISSSVPGTGPYRIGRWNEGERIRLEPNDDYRGEKPEIGTIDYFFVKDPSIRRLGLESGQYDFIDMVLSDDIPGLEADSGIRLLEGSETGSIAIVFNKKEGISTDQGFRRAVALAVDREALMRACYGEHGYSIHSDYMEHPWSVDPSLDAYGSMDLAESARYLRESGYSGETVRILVSNLTDLDKIAVALAQSLEEAGIRTRITVLDWAAFLEKRRDESAWDIYVSALSRVMLPLDKLYLSPSSPGGLEDSECLGLIAAVGEAGSMEEARELWEKAQIRLWEYVPAIVPGHYSTVYASSAELLGVDLSDGFHFRNAYIGNGSR